MVATNKKKWMIGLATTFVILIVGLTVGLLVTKKKSDNDEPEHLDPTLGIYKNAAISSDAPECADIGKDMLQRNGSVADAAIATLLCMGVKHSMSMGIGGGFLAVYYDATTSKSYSLVAREMAPEAATEDMFKGNPIASARGPLAVAVPGEIKGYRKLWEEAGKLPWKELFTPTIEICRSGFKVSRSLATALREQQTRIKNETNSMREILVNEETGEVFQEGDIVKRLKLADTLEIIANEGAEVLYTGRLATDLVNDLQAQGAIITMEDLANYNVKWSDESLKVRIHHGDFTLHTVPPPGSGLLSAFIFRLMSLFQPTVEDELTVHRIVEVFKHTFAQRTKLGDIDDANITATIEQLVWNLTVSEEYLLSTKNLIKDDITNNTHEYYGAEFYQPEDHGTAHVSIIGPNGDAIAVTSTVNLYFGAVLRSPSTGIIYNDEMDDFSAPNITNAFGVPPSPNNFIRPRKRPVSSMTPSIFTDTEGKVRLVVGAAGGTRITTSVALTAMRNLWFGKNIKQGIDSPRFHHQIYPMEVTHERDYHSDIINGLKARNHTTYSMDGTMAVVCGVARDAQGTIYANSDWRKAGSIAGF